MRPESPRSQLAFERLADLSAACFLSRHMFQPTLKLARKRASYNELNTFPRGEKMLRH